MSSANEDKIVKEALGLVDQGWEQLDCQDNVIYVLGGTGAGKSTVTQIVTGDLQKLHSKPEQHGTGYVIVDQVEEGSGSPEGRIGDPRVASKTFLPEYLTCADDPSLVFVDCPGFNDNRGTQMDIAAMVLIKKISEQVDKARFLFVVPYSSVSYSNLNRNDFLQLCSHATAFIKNLDKVKDSIGLIITRVNNCNPATGGAIEDHAVINETSTFLNEIMGHGSTPIESKKFIEHLLSDQSKWTLIHYPSDIGPLDKMDHYHQVRQKIRDICKNKLRSAPVTPHDFAITLSSDSKYIIVKRLVPFMKVEIDRIVKGVISEDMDAVFCARFQAQVQNQGAISTMVAALKNLEGICNYLKTMNDGGCGVTSKITRIAGWLQTSLPEAKLSELRKVEEQLDLFQQVTEERDLERGNSVQITNSLNSLKSKLEELYKSTLKLVKESRVPDLEALISEQVNRIISKFADSYRRDFWNSLGNGDNAGLEALRKMSGDWTKFEALENNGVQEGQKMSVVLKQLGNEMATRLDGDAVNILEEFESQLDTLLELTGGRSFVNGGRVFGCVRNFLTNLRTEAKEKIRNEKIGAVHSKIRQETASLLGGLECTFFRDKFYPGLSMSTMSSKRQMLAGARAKLLQFWGNFDGILDGMRKIFGVFEMELSSTEANYLEQWEDLLDFYDNFLGTSVPRPVQEWLSKARSLQDRVDQLERLYEFLERSKGAYPQLIEGDLVSKDGDLDATVSKFLEALGATQDIGQIVAQRACGEDKLVIASVANYLDSERSRLKAEAERNLVATNCYHEGGRSSSSGSSTLPLGRDDGAEALLELITLPAKIINSVAGRLFRF